MVFVIVVTFVTSRGPVTGSLMIKRVGVVGAGTMGNGIAQVFAQSGFDVALRPCPRHRSRAGAREDLGKFVEGS